MYLDELKKLNFKIIYSFFILHKLGKHLFSEVNLTNIFKFE